MCNRVRKQGKLRLMAHPRLDSDAASIGMAHFRFGSVTVFHRPVWAVKYVDHGFIWIFRAKAHFAAILRRKNSPN
jgi:hypothetical protein